MDEIKASDFTAAMKLRERDMRARMIADSCVAMAMEGLRNEYPQEPYSKARDFAYRAASLAAALLVSGIYIGDEEIRSLREERDRLKDQVRELSLAMPPRLVIEGVTGGNAK